MDPKHRESGFSSQLQRAVRYAAQADSREDVAASDAASSFSDDFSDLESPVRSLAGSRASRRASQQQLSALTKVSPLGARSAEEPYWDGWKSVTDATTGGGLEYEEYICERNLHTWAGLAAGGELTDVTELDLLLDTRNHQPEHLGLLLPSLQRLRLTRGSVLGSFRDLGTSLRGLRVLWAPGCGINELDGVGALLGLEELYLPFNAVADLTAIAMHDSLQVLDLEANCITDLAEAEQLGTCPGLWSLTLTGNPVARGGQRYRSGVCCAIPQLLLLDDESVTDADRQESVADLVQAVSPNNETASAGPVSAGQGVLGSSASAGMVWPEFLEPPEVDEAAIVCEAVKWLRLSELIPIPEGGGATFLPPPPEAWSPSLEGGRLPSSRGSRGTASPAPSELLYKVLQLPHPSPPGRAPQTVGTGSGSALTRGADEPLAGNPAQGLRRWRAQSAPDVPAARRGSQTSTISSSEPPNDWPPALPVDVLRPATTGGMMGLGGAELSQEISAWRTMRRRIDEREAAATPRPSSAFPTSER